MASAARTDTSLLSKPPLCILETRILLGAPAPLLPAAIGEKIRAGARNTPTKLKPSRSGALAPTRSRRKRSLSSDPTLGRWSQPIEAAISIAMLKPKLPNPKSVWTGFRERSITTTDERRGTSACGRERDVSCSFLLAGRQSSILKRFWGDGQANE